MDDLNEGWGIEIYKDYFYNNIDHYANSGGYCYFYIIRVKYNMGNELPPYIMPKFRIANYNTNSDIILGIEILFQGHAISNRKKIRINRKKNHFVL